MVRFSATKPLRDIMPDPEGGITKAQGGQDDTTSGPDDYQEMSTSAPEGEEDDAVRESALQQAMHSQTPCFKPRPDRSRPCPCVRERNLLSSQCIARETPRRDVRRAHGCLLGVPAHASVRSFVTLSLALSQHAQQAHQFTKSCIYAKARTHVDVCAGEGARSRSRAATTSSCQQAVQPHRSHPKSWRKCM